ncbi:DUF2007 domain-containing protein [Anaerophilus nitritogenes]|uniref:putative signal transducing protein n=1 Tax=Anaerophilus nitritogenes TaxID=2498136 RepID=UPI00101CD702|nr:DUF2007 domain-containing protein [Anaerophilus nitritogenes]
MIFKRIFKNLFLKNQWKNIYTTQDVGQYAKIKGILEQYQIEVRTKINNDHMSGIEVSIGINKKRVSTYHIYVKVEDVHRAKDVL